MKHIKMLTILALCLLPIFALLGAKSSSEMSNDDFKVMILVCNLSPDGLNIKIGDEDTTVFYTVDLDQYDTTALTVVDETGTYNVYYRYSEDDDWEMFETEDEGDDYTVTLESGKVLGLIITPNNHIYDSKLKFDATFAGKVTFANLSDHTLPMMEVSKEFGDKDVIWSEDLGEYSLTNFGDVDTDDYSLYWVVPDQKDTDNYYFYPDLNGNPDKFDIVRKKWYMMMVYDKDGKSMCNFFNITPKDSPLKD